MTTQQSNSEQTHTFTLPLFIEVLVVDVEGETFGS